VILLCLPTSAQVRTVIFGPDGLLPGLRRGALLVDQTSGEPNATRAMAAEFAPSGVALIDAPVSGGMAGAEAGTIAIMVGGEPEELARVRPVLEAISRPIWRRPSAYRRLSITIGEFGSSPPSSS
jgi:3-hydroxyisobutyrate dehydrogenase